MAKRSSTQIGATRRGFLKGAAGAGGLLALSLGAGRAAQAQSAGDDLQTILNIAATLEQFATTHIYTLLTARNFELTEAEIKQAKIILDAEYKHLELALENGGQPFDNSFFAPAGVYDSRARFAQVTAEVETVCTAVYLAAARRIAELGNPRLSATMGQLAANEAQHAAVARDLIGLPPSDNAWMPPLFYNVSDVRPVVEPFLNGAEGFEGPVAYPGFERISAALGDVRAAAYPLFVNTF